MSEQNAVPDDNWDFGQESDSVLASVSVVLDQEESREVAVKRLLPTLKTRYAIRVLDPSLIIEKPIAGFPDFKNAGINLRFTEEKQWVIDKPIIASS